MKHNPEEVQALIETHKTNKEVGFGGWCGYWAPDGWADLLYALHLLLEFTDPDYKVQQVKEKFGGLCFYVEPGLSEVGKMLIKEAEKLSFTVCQQCGQPGKLIKPSWWATLCEEHSDPETTTRGYHL